MSFWSRWGVGSVDSMKVGLLPGGAASGRLATEAPAGDAAMPRTVDVLSLDRAATGEACRVLALHAPAGQADWARWLAEIGFLPGERVTVMHRSVWGGDPMVVRVGQSSFALRRAEAACVQVEPLREPLR